MQPFAMEVVQPRGVAGIGASDPPICCASSLAVGNVEQAPNLPVRILARKSSRSDLPVRVVSERRLNVFVEHQALRQLRGQRSIIYRVVLAAILSSIP